MFFVTIGALVVTQYCEISPCRNGLLSPLVTRALDPATRWLSCRHYSRQLSTGDARRWASEQSARTIARYRSTISKSE
jgi:hypothetical protein